MRKYLNYLLVVLGALLVSCSASAWTGPLSEPPACNQEGCNLPINVSNTDQIKNGGLSIGALLVNGGAYIGDISGADLIAGQVPKVLIVNQSTNSAYDQGLFVQNSGSGYAISASGPFGIRAHSTDISKIAFQADGGDIRLMPGGFTGKVGQVWVSKDLYGAGQWKDPSTILSSNDNFWASSTDGRSIYAKNYLSGGNVGIGLDNPKTKLDISGTVTYRGDLVNNLYYDSGWKYRGAGVGWLFQTSNGGNLDIWSAPNNTSGAGVAAPISFRLTVSNDTGNVGIGTATPNYKLTVNTGGFSVEDSSTNLGGFTVSSNGRIGTFSGIPSGTTLTTASLVVNPANGGDVNRLLFGVGHGGVARFTVDAEGDIYALGNLTVAGTGNSSFAGNVGVGVTNPAAKLEVNGSVKLKTPGFSQVGMKVLTSSDNLGNAEWRTVDSLGLSGGSGGTSLPTGSDTQTLYYNGTTLTAANNFLNINGLALLAQSELGMKGTNFIEFGKLVSGKDTNAGKIGYQTFTTGALDIVGAGTVAGSRNVKVWDNLNVPGNISAANLCTTAGTCQTVQNILNSIGSPVRGGFAYDVTGDGSVNAADVTLVNNCADDINCSSAQYYRSDVNRDGSVDSTDATLVAASAAQFTSAAGTSYWSANGTGIYNSNSGNVGIGVVSANTKMQIRVGSNQNIGFSSDSNEARISTFSDSFTYQTPLRIQGSSISLTGGNVGIGLTSPQAPLDVSGNAVVRGVAKVSGLQLDSADKGSGKVLVSDANGVASWQDPAKGFFGKVIYGDQVGPTRQGNDGCLGAVEPAYCYFPTVSDLGEPRCRSGYQLVETGVINIEIVNQGSTYSAKGDHVYSCLKS